MIHLEGTNLGLALGNRNMARPVVSHEHHVIRKIRGVVFGEGPARAKDVHDFHRLGVLDLIFTGNGDTPCREQTGSENDGADGIFIFQIAGALIVVRQGAQFVDLNHPIQSDRSARCTV